MNRLQLEHIIRAAASIANDDEIRNENTGGMIGLCIEIQDLTAGKVKTFYQYIWEVCRIFAHIRELLFGSYVNYLAQGEVLVSFFRL